MSENNKRADVYARVTNQIIQAIEQGTGPWQMPWRKSESALQLPANAATGNRYRGVNVVMLWVSAYLKGYREPTWATFNQWQELGCTVRKGEQASLGVYWNPAAQSNANSESGEPSTEGEPARSRAVARSFPLFNAEQVDGYEIPEEDAPELPQRIDRAERFFRSLGAEIRIGGNEAAYNRKQDIIRMPPFEAFLDPTAFYGTLAHECTHWTGHESRLNRDLSGRFRSESYAAEELIAELGGAFVAADLQLAAEPREETTAYVDSWLKILKGDSRAIFAAASHAQRALDFMHSLQPTHDVEHGVTSAPQQAGSLTL